MWVASALGVGGAILGAGALTAGATAYGASRAADAQTRAAQLAANTAQQQYQQTRSDLAPFRGIGVDAANRLGARLDELTKPIELTQEWLESTPGYQFTRTQGLKSVQNSAAARGLANSGAALKGAATFATGLADNTYQTQFNVANTNQTNAFNRLKALIDTGQSSAAQTGTLGANAANTAAGAQIGAGNAQAAASNAIAGGVSNLGNNIAGYSMYRGLYGGGNFGGSPESNPNLRPIGT